MRSQQSGFTLVEIAIVLVIIGLLLGGILKGQELINSARVKNLANDFRVIPTYIYAYQDRFRALPGDDSAASTHLAGPPVATNATTNGTAGNGVIEGNWSSATKTDESYLFWQHVRLANLAPGSTDVNDAGYPARNALGGLVGVSSATTALVQIQNMTGTYQVCSGGIPGRFAKQLDVTMDDGQTNTGSMRAVPDASALGTAATTTATIDDAAAYTVCMTF
jgi:prepilin-type N-terminal cleavage/methylation domain-containing protein